MDESVKTIELTGGQVALVDGEDYEQLSQHKWHTQKYSDTFYAKRHQNGKMVFMHREILKAPEHLQCDHKNHDGLDNRRCNIRLCTHAQNSYNKRPLANRTSKYKGVHWDKNAKKWQAQIKHNERVIHIGYFDDQIDAALAYDDYAIDLFQEFAYLNYQHHREITKWIEENYLFSNEKINCSETTRCQ